MIFVTTQPLKGSSKQAELTLHDILIDIDCVKLTPILCISHL
jgi:hypothetical protein